MNWLADLLQRAKIIFQTEGTVAMLRRVALLLISPFFSLRTYELYEYALGNALTLDEADFKPKIDDIVLKIVSSNQEADEIEAEGFAFRSCPTQYNTNLEQYTQWLDQGAIACPVFIGQNLAAITWIITTPKTQNAIGAVPLKVDYSNNEVFARGTWTNPAYRGLGLVKYNYLFNRDRFLLKLKKSVVRSAFEDSNQIGKDMVASIGYKRYAEARLTKIPGWKLWKETPLH